MHAPVLLNAASILIAMAVGPSEPLPMTPVNVGDGPQTSSVTASGDTNSQGTVVPAQRTETSQSIIEDPRSIEVQYGRDVAGSDRTMSEAEFVEHVLHHLPDPIDARKDAAARLAAENLPIRIGPLERLIARIDSISRPEKLYLTLEDTIERMLANSFSIRVASYNPAIEQTRVVEAEAAFDASFFTSLTNNKVDQPTANALQGSKIEQFSLQSGIRKQLPTGMQLQAFYSVDRSSNNFQFQTLNPQWISRFVVDMRQPLLRGFGLDANRSQIRLSKIGRRVATQQYRRQIRETVKQVEESYWRLVQARRALVVSAKLLASFEQIYNKLDARREFDVYTIQLADTRARLESSKADFIQLAANVQNAEDRLIALINDPELDLAGDIEIVPVSVPNYLPLAIDRLDEVNTALENRAELVEAKLGINSANIRTGVAKNQAMPQLDVTFRYTVDGLGPSSHDSFSQLTKHDFTEYFIGIDFEIPIGNRARRAALKREKLQQAQAIANLKQTFEQVILETNVAVRNLNAQSDQIEPSLIAANAREDQVESIIERAEKQDFLTLNNELNTRQGLAAARSDLLSAMIDYGIGIIELERSKGTLLRYNNIELAFDDSDDPNN
ncbi:MAG: hypothetical protein DHS20C16_19860 [Phycisphaerae bacterium]|nr:MAG: hypothetical protein DHS20C16_19860 [Phycisphaerae bacterium]